MSAAAPTMRLSIHGGCDDDGALVGAAISTLRHRTLARWRTFGEADWSARSRCADWNCHDTVRHVVDVTEVHAAQLHGEPAPFDAGAGFDPHETPKAWIARSADEAPAATLDRYERALARELDALAARVGRRDPRRGHAPYGEVPWAIVAYHVYWDAWIHDRDVTIDRSSGSSGEEDLAAALYALAFAAVPSAWSDRALDVVVGLEDVGSAVRVVAEGPDAWVDTGARRAEARVATRTTDVVDALAGRVPLAGAIDGPPEIVAQLAMIRSVLVPPA